MFKIDNNRLGYGGISIPLPSGLYLDVHSECIYKNGFVLRSENESFYIKLNFYEYTESIEEDLKASYAAEDSGIESSVPIIEFELNGLHGVRTTY